MRRKWTRFAFYVTVALICCIVARLLTTDRPKLTIQTHAWFLSGIGFSPDGATLLSAASSDRCVRLWDSKTGEPRSSRELHQGVNTLSLSSRSCVAAFSLIGGSHEVVIWRYEKSGDYRVVRGTALDRVVCVALSPDGTLLAMGLLDGRIRLWDSRSATFTTAPLAHESAVMSVVFASTGQWVVSSGWEGAVMRWDIGSGAQTPICRLDHRVPRVLAISPDDGVLAVGDNDGDVSLVKLPSGGITQVLRTKSAVHALQFSPNGTLLACASGSCVDIWRTGSWQLWKSWRCHPIVVESLGFSPSGDTLASGGFRGEIKLWDIDSL
jgi:WD40 repeat protein